MRFIDSHVHLSDYADPGTVIRVAGLTRMILGAVSIDKRTSAGTLALSHQAPGIVKGFVGVHPSEAGKAGDMGWVEEWVGGAAGVGEVGMDEKYLNESPIKDQEKAFSSQLATAEKAGKPVQVHTRGKEAACLETMTSFGLKRALLHWFQDGGLSSKAADRGYFVSFGPALLYSKKLQKLAMAYDRQLVIAETDGPVAFRHLGGAEGPTLIPSVVFCLSEIYGEPFDEVANRVERNSLGYLGIEKG